MKNETPPNAAGKAHFDLLREWAREIEQDFDAVLKASGSTDSGRTTKSRVVNGTASLATAHKIAQALQKLETKTGKRATVGPQALLLQEWTEARRPTRAECAARVRRCPRTRAQDR